MYYSHFGLKQPPFKITPNTEFFFSGGNRGAVLDALVYAITSGEGIIKVVGEVGSGKTMLCRMLESLLPESVERVYLANPSVAPEDILHAIAFELQLDLPQDADRLQVMQALQNHLIMRHAENRQVVIFVEEAQGMPLPTLEEIRLLSNLETKNDKLLQIVLFGQPELDENLNQPHIRQLKERITHSFNLGPLADHDIGDYLIYRLRTAGYFGPPLFTKSAVKRIARASKGLVRRINILADKALLAAFAENAYAITPRHVGIAIQDSEFSAEETKLVNTRAGYQLAAGMLVVGLALGFGLQALMPKTPAPASAPVSSAPPATEAAKTANIPATPSAAASASPAPEKVSPPVATAPSAPESVVQAEPQPAPVTAANPTRLLGRRLEATRTWLEQQPPETVTIQLMTSGETDKMSAQFESLAQTVAVDNLYAYRTSANGQAYLSILYGSYPNRNSALKALADLPKSLRAYRPRLRTTGGIAQEIKSLQ